MTDTTAPRPRAAAAPDPPAVAALRALLDGEHAETRDRVREWLSMPGNSPAADLPMAVRAKNRVPLSAASQQLRQ